MRQLIWTCVVVWLGACAIPPDVKAQIACTTICTCFVGQLDVEECTNECVEEGDFQQLPEDCFECIQTHANQCSMLEDECEALCARPEPPVEDLPDGGMQ
jgi:hypothetical protein